MSEIKEILARAGIVVALMAGATVIILAMPDHAEEQPPAAQTTTAAEVECSSLDASCLAGEWIEQQETAEPTAVVEPICKETEDYDNGYTCALVTETGPVYATASSTCPAEETQGLFNFTELIRCADDAKAATIAATQGQTVISWEVSDYNGANAWNLWRGI